LRIVPEKKIGNPMMTTAMAVVEGHLQDTVAIADPLENTEVNVSSDVIFSTHDGLQYELEEILSAVIVYSSQTGNDGFVGF